MTTETKRLPPLKVCHNCFAVLPVAVHQCHECGEMTLTWQKRQEKSVQ